MGKVRIDAYAAWIRYCNGQSVQSIAVDFGVSRIGIWKAWKRIGYSTDGFRVERPCAWCGRVVLRHRQMALNTERSFCNHKCYLALVRANGEGYKPWRQGSRRARLAVSKVFDLQSVHVVHHVDGNGRHNQLSNLWVFASQADHLSYHRGGKAQPIFRGDLYRAPVGLDADLFPEFAE